MAIENISFKGIFGNKKVEEKNKTHNPIEKKHESKKMTKSEKAAMDKIRDNILANYAAAAMRIGAAATIGAAGLSSCMEQNVDLQISPEFKLWIQQMQQTLEKMLKELEENKEANKEQVQLNKQILALLNQILSGVTDIKDGLKVIESLIKASNAFDVEFMAKIQTIINSQKDSQQILQELLKAHEEQQKTLTNIEKLIETTGKDNKELGQTLKEFYESFKESDKNNTEYQNTHSKMMENIFNAILGSNEISASILKEVQGFRKDFEAGKMTEAEMWAKITALLESIDGKLDGLIDAVKGLEESVGNLVNGSGEKILDVLNKLLEQFHDHSITSNSLAAQILEELKTSNLQDKEAQAKLDKIYEELKSGNKTAAEALTEITQILNAIKENTDIIKDSVAKIIETIKELEGSIGNIVNGAGEKISEKFDQLIEKFENQSITSNSLAAQILEELKTSNLQDKEAQAKLDKIYEELKSGNKTAAEALTEITQILNAIKENTDVIKDAVLKISQDIVKYGDLITQKQDQGLDILGNLNNNITNIGDDIKKLIEINKEANKNLVNISNSIDKINVKLDKVTENQGNQLTINDLKELFGPSFESMMKILGDINGNQISKEELKELLDAHKTDLTKTNSLIETLTTVVQNLNLGSGMTAELKAVVAKLEELKNINAEGNKNIVEELEGVREEVAGLKGIMSALVTTANEIKTNQEANMANAKIFGTKLFEEMNKLGSNMLDKNTFAVFAESYKEQLVKAEQTRQEQKVILQTILENMSKDNGGGVNIDDLIAKLPNYTAILNEISEKIGKVITSSDLENFYIKTQPDLTKTNNLIETLTTVVQSLNTSSGGSSGLTTQILESIKTTTNQILSAINKGQLADETQLQALLDTLAKIESNTKPEAPSTKSLAQAQRTFDKENLALELAKAAIKGDYIYKGWDYVGKNLDA